MDQPEVQIAPECFFRDVWHVNCQVNPGRGIMKRLSRPERQPDGSVLAKFRCLHCGVETMGGLDAQDHVITRAVAMGAVESAVEAR